MKAFLRLPYLKEGYQYFVHPQNITALVSISNIAHFEGKVSDEAGIKLRKSCETNKLCRVPAPAKLSQALYNILVGL